MNVSRQAQVAAMTVRDLLDWCAERGLDPSAVSLTGTHLKWESPQTEAERERRETFDREQAKRVEDWERQTFERLLPKFGRTE